MDLLWAPQDPKVPPSPPAALSPWTIPLLLMDRNKRWPSVFNHHRVGNRTFSMETAEVRCVQRHGNCAERNGGKEVLQRTLIKRTTVVVTFVSLSAYWCECTKVAQSQRTPTPRDSLEDLQSKLSHYKARTFCLCLFLNKYCWALYKHSGLANTETSFCICFSGARVKVKWVRMTPT